MENFIKCLKNLLQQDIKIYIKGENNRLLWKHCKLILFNVKGFAIECTVKIPRKSKLERFEIPIPFTWRQENMKLIMSYEFDNLIKDPIIINMIRNVKSKRRSKFFNSVVEIEGNYAISKT